jgi:hypothetical protein
MTPSYEIRADHDTSTIVVYQAFGDAIADAALRAGRFVAPFSFRSPSSTCSGTPSGP